MYLYSKKIKMNTDRSIFDPFSPIAILAYCIPDTNEYSASGSLHYWYTKCIEFFQITTRPFYCVIKALDPEITNLVRVREINIAHGYTITIPNASCGTIYRVGYVGMCVWIPPSQKVVRLLSAFRSAESFGRGAYYVA